MGKMGKSSERGNMQAFLLLPPLLLILTFKVNDGRTARHFLVEIEETPEKKWTEKMRKGKGGAKERLKKGKGNRPQLDYDFKSAQLFAEEYVPPSKIKTEADAEAGQSYDDVLDATEPNELSGWNCPCFAACDEIAEGSNLRKICEKDCAKTCKS